jgi:hypothetical protein
VSDSFINKLGAAFSGETAEKSISKNILKKVNPQLSSSEKRRLQVESTIFAETLINLQRKEKKDTFGETQTKKDTPIDKAANLVKEGKEEKPPKFKFPLMLGLAAGIIAFATWISEFLGPVGEFVSKVLPKLLKPLGGFVSKSLKAIKGGMLMKMLGGIAAKIGGKIAKYGRFIPVIGSLFSFGFGIARWKKGEYIPAIMEFVSGILNLLPFGVTNVASMIIDGALLLYDLDKEATQNRKDDPSGESFSMWDKILEFFMMSPGIGNIINLAKGIGAVFRGEWGEAGKYFMYSIPIVGNLLNYFNKDGSMGDTAGEIAGSLFEGTKSLFGTILDFIEGIPIIGRIVTLGRGFAALFSGNFAEAADKFAEVLPGPIAKFIKFLASMSADGGKKGIEFMKDMGVDFSSPLSIFTSIGSLIFGGIGDMLTGAYDWVKEKVAGMIEGAKELPGKIFDGAKSLGSKALSFLNPFDDFLVRGDKVIPFNNKDDVVGMKEGGAIANLIRNGTGINAEELVEAIKIVVKDNRSGATETAISPMLSALSSTFIGRVGAKMFGFKPKEKKDAKKTEVNFSDEVLDKLVATRTVRTNLVKNVFDASVTSEIKKSNEYLAQLVQLTAKMLGKQGAPVPSAPPAQQQSDIAPMQGDMSGPSFVDSRTKFNNSTYSFA